MVFLFSRVFFLEFATEPRVSDSEVPASTVGERPEKTCLVVFPLKTPRDSVKAFISRKAIAVV